MEQWKPEPTGILQLGFREAHKRFPNGGLCLEFGVGMGHSFCWQALQIVEWAKNSRLLGFDSFEGLPAETPGVWAPERHGKGCFWYPHDILIEHMKACGLPLDDPRFQTVEGFFEQSLTRDLQKQLMQEELIFVNCDVDIHSSTIQMLDFIKPMIHPNLIVYFDDYKDPIDEKPGVKDPSIKEWGEHLAWRQWTEKNNVKYVLGETNNLNQRFFIVTEC